VTNPLQKSTDPYGDLVRRILAIENEARDALRRPFTIPTLNADPPESDPTNIWMFPDGRIRSRHLNPAGSAFVYREWVSSAPGSGTSATAPAAPVTSPVTQQQTFLAQWSHSYRSTGGGAQRTDQGAVMLYYGSSGDSFNGTNRSLVGFDHAAISAALAGSTVNSVHLRLVNVHAWYNSGVNIYFGIHNFSSKPGTWTGGGIPAQRIVSHKFGKPQERYVPMPLAFATMIRDGTGKGIAIEAPDSSREFYGYAAGVGSGYNVPALIIQYTK
jgi:hypothetical protein